MNEKNYAFCLIPVRQKGCSPAWEVSLTDGCSDTALVLAAPDEMELSQKYGFANSYAFILPDNMTDIPQLDAFLNLLPGICVNFYVKAHGHRALNPSRGMLIPLEDLGDFCEKMNQFKLNTTGSLTDKLNELKRDVAPKTLLEMICQNTMATLYPKKPFAFWQQVVTDGYVRLMIERNVWQESRRPGATEHPYISPSGYLGTQQFEYTYYGAPDGMSDDGLRDTSKYIKELTKEKWGEEQIKKFLKTVNPLECGQYICGIKITDRSSYNNGGAGGGSKRMFLYDKAAVYDGMTESGLFPLN